MIEFLVVFAVGAVVGAVVGFFLALERFMRTEKPIIKVEVTQEVVKDIHSQVVALWLEAHGLTWMPKGVDFRPKVKP